MLTYIFTISTCSNNKANYLYVYPTCMLHWAAIPYLHAYHKCLHTEHARSIQHRFSIANMPLCLPTKHTYFACISPTGTSDILDHQLAPSITYPSQPAYRDYLQCLHILYATKLTCKLICIFGLHDP